MTDTDDIEPEELDEMEERANAITLKRWKHAKRDAEGDPFLVFLYGHESAFIAHAKEDIPRLCRCIRKMLAFMQAEYEKALDELERLQQEDKTR